MIKEYDELLKNDLDYAEKTTRISELTLDIAEIFVDETLLNQLPEGQYHHCFSVSLYLMNQN